MKDRAPNPLVASTSVMPPTSMVRSVTFFLKSYLISGVKQTEFHLKTDHFPG